MGWRFVCSCAVIAHLGTLISCSDIDMAQNYRELQSQLSEESQRIWEVISHDVDDVERVLVESAGKTVEVIRTDQGLWSPGTGAKEVSASLMFEAERVVFPMRSYRRLNVDASDPAFGFGDNDLSATIRTLVGTSKVRFGRTTFSGGGIYASLENDPAVYVVIPAVADSLLSVWLGEKVNRGIDPRFAEALNQLQLVTVEEEKLNPWLAQVIEFQDSSN